MNHADITGDNPLVLVTGANSLLGTNIVECLLRKGYKVRGLLRDAGRFHLGPHPDLTLTEGDFTDRVTAQEAVWGCDYVIHVAACTDQGVPDYGHYQKINVEATEQLFMLAAKAGVRRFVYVSTANCFGFGSKESPGDETRPPRSPFTGSHYARSKQESQARLLGLKHLMDVVIVNPTFMLGAYDSKPSSGQIILMGYRKRVVFCPPGGKNFIHVADAAAAAVSALTQGVSGETYLLSGENLTYREFFGKLVGVAGNRPLCIVLPRPLLITVGYLGNLLQRAGISNRFTLANMRILCVGNYYTNAKAVEDLGLTTAPVEAAITDALQWFRHNGMVK